MSGGCVHVCECMRRQCAGRPDEGAALFSDPCGTPNNTMEPYIINSCQPVIQRGGLAETTVVLSLIMQAGIRYAPLINMGK